MAISYFRVVNRFRLLLRYIRYFISSTNEHGVHSPFVFNLVTKVIYNKKRHYAYGAIGQLRDELLRDETEISITDLGAGSRVNASRKRKVKDIAANSSKPPKYGELLFRLVEHFRPATMLELGTSLGISAAYQASAAKDARMITIEGCPGTAAIAVQTLERHDLDNAEVMVGDFEKILPAALSKLGSIDHAFFDGNHRKEPTLRYFEQALNHSRNDSVFIFDDIHWSEEMEEAWIAIKEHPRVTVTIDLFFIGLVFFRKEQRKEHFVIRY